MGSNGDPYAQENIFAVQARIEAESLPEDREKPRANLYNVIKCLRENAVSSAEKIKLLNHYL